jgi:hypothetical protein
VVSCDDDKALWKFKYTGGKGPKKIFKGTGKLSFTKQITPPHGYDYGMKSGICLFVDEEVSIQIHFLLAILFQVSSGLFASFLCLLALTSIGNQY